MDDSFFPLNCNSVTKLISRQFCISFCTGAQLLIGHRQLGGDGLYAESCSNGGGYKEGRG